jgi:hypothetical protein
VEFSFERGKIVITPKVVIDRSKFPTADDEYTPAQRRAIDAAREERSRFQRQAAHMDRLAPPTRQSHFCERGRRTNPPNGNRDDHRLSDQAIAALREAPPNVRRAFEKQLRFLAADIQHPSLHAKKYGESRDLWQAV